MSGPIQIPVRPPNPDGSPLPAPWPPEPAGNPNDVPDPDHQMEIEVTTVVE